MANNCLHEKLKAVVSDDSLTAIGELRFKVINGINDELVPFAVSGSSAFTAKIIGDGYFYKGTIDSQTNITTEISNVTTTGGYRLSPGEYYVSIIPKYGLTSINIRADKTKNYSIQLDIDQFKFFDAPIELLVSTQSNVIGGHFPITGDLSNLQAGSYLSVTNTDITGTLKDFAKLRVENFASTGAAAEIPGKNISGSIEEYAENLNSINYGKTIALITNFMYPGAPSPNTFHGAVYSSTIATLVVDSSGNVTVKTGNSTIGTYTKATNTWSYV